MTALLLRLFVKDSKNITDPAVRERYGKLGGTVGIICNILLCIIKILIGSITASISIVADGLNNLSDMGSSVVTLIAFKMSGKPADSDHPFGHGRIEYLSALAVAMLIIVVGFELVTSSVGTLVSGGKAPTYSLASAIVLVTSILIKLWMFFFNRRLGKLIDSDVLNATAQDSINDCIATAAILASVMVSFIFDLPFNLDAVMALLVGLFIIWSGISSAKDTVDQLLGTPPEQSVINELEQIILSFEEFIGIHDLIVHNYGYGRLFASVHVEVPQNSDIVACHEQIDLCEKLVGERMGVMLVIHMDPIDVDNEAVLNARERIASAVSSIHSGLSIHDFRMTPMGKERTNLIFDVVVPSDAGLDEVSLKEQIGEIARGIDRTYCCVITVDHDFTGR